MERMRALETEEAPLSARLSLEGDKIRFYNYKSIVGQCEII